MTFPLLCGVLGFLVACGLALTGEDTMQVPMATVTDAEQIVQALLPEGVVVHVVDLSDRTLATVFALALGSSHHIPPDRVPVVGLEMSVIGGPPFRVCLPLGRSGLFPLDALTHWVV